MSAGAMIILAMVGHRSTLGGQCGRRWASQGRVRWAQQYVDLGTTRGSSRSGHISTGVRWGARDQGCFGEKPLVAGAGGRFLESGGGVWDRVGGSSFSGRGVVFVIFAVGKGAHEDRLRQLVARTFASSTPTRVSHGYKLCAPAFYHCSPPLAQGLSSRCGWSGSRST